LRRVTIDAARSAALSFGFARLFALARAFAQALRPALLNHLLAAAERQRAGRHVPGDDRAGADIGAVADFHRRNQRRVRADERALADVGVVFRGAIVIARDRSRAHVRAGPDTRIADVGEMVRLRASLDFRSLHLDEIADVHVHAEIGAGTQARI